MSGLNPETKRTLRTASLLANQGQIEAALAEIESALLNSPHDLHLWSNRLFYLLADPQQSQTELDAAFLAYGKVLKPLAQQEIQPDLSPDRRLKIAYLSGHFCQHALARVTSSLFRFHDPQHFEITIYANQSQGDHMTDWFAAHCEQFVEVSHLSDTELAERIRADKIDILVDLAGHSDRHRLRVFTAKAAPIQISAGLGLVASTGLAAIDYRLVDLSLLPVNTVSQQAETPLYLSQLLHWDPLPVIQALPLTPPPFIRRGYITFGSSNRSYKLNAEVLSCWAEILKQVPGAKLAFKCQQFDNPAIKQAFITRLAKLGIGAERLRFAGQTPTREHVAFYSEYDIALDPFPYQGGLSTFEALHMGLPVIARDMPTGSRASLSILRALGGDAFAEDWIADSSAEYIAKAVQMARNPAALIDWRQNLRQSLFQSKLMNGLQFTREVENAYRWAWQRFCQGHSPAPLKHDQRLTNDRRCIPDPQAQARTEALSVRDWPVSYQLRYLEQARLDFEMGRFGHCEAICDHVLSLDSPLAEAFYWKGLIAFQAQDFERAQHHLQQAIELQPELSVYQVNLGHVLRAAGQEQAAHDIYQHALRRNPELSQHYQEMGIEISL